MSAYWNTKRSFSSWQDSTAKDSKVAHMNIQSTNTERWKEIVTSTTTSHFVLPMLRIRLAWGEFRTLNALHHLSPKASDDKTPFKTNLWVEGWSCTRAANKIHKEGPILKASEEVDPLMATGTRSWKKQIPSCARMKWPDRKYEENANSKQTQNIRCIRI